MNQMYLVAQAKRDFELGFLKKYRIERAPMGGWALCLGEGMTAAHLIDQRKKEVRVFKTLDAAVSTLEQIGFRVTVLLQS